MSVSIPKEMNYSTLPPEAVLSQARREQWNSDNGTAFNSLTNNYIRIPIKSTGFLNPNSGTLNFNITNNTAVQIGIDSTIASIINRMRITCGSTVIQDFNNYHVLHNFLYHNQGTLS